MSVAIVGLATTAIARPNIKVGTGAGNKQGLLKTTAGCFAAVSNIDLDINNVRARYLTGGDMWWDQGSQVAAYEVPINSGKSSQFAASCWIGGVDPQGQLKVAAQTYRQDGNDYWPGALDALNDINTAECSDWDQFWKVNRSDIVSFIAMRAAANGTAPQTPQYAAINGWPATGNINAYGASGGALNLVAGRSYAPFIDANGDGKYNTADGDYPDIKGDQYIWWVFNDKGNVKLQSQTPAIGVEVQTSAFAYTSQDFLNNATFCNYRVINRGTTNLDSTYIAVWDDMDLGYAFDDYIGCDTSRGLGIGYNGASVDGTGQVNSYGANPPMVGVDFFQGPIRQVKKNGVTVDSTLSMTNFTYYVNTSSPTIGNPTNGVGIYYYMTGSILDGARFADDFKGPGIATNGFGTGPASHFVFWGDPSDNTQWSECACQNLPGDRRFIESAGPFTLYPGAVNDITFGCVWAPGIGGCGGGANFKTIQAIDDQAQALFDNNFQQIEGPEAPVMTVRELDKHLAFYLTNPYGSNNYKEQFGRSDSAKYQQISIKAAKVLHLSDSLYRFEGYRVFQLADGSISPAQIYGSNGEVDNTKAVEVFECDIHDSITKIVNYVKRTDLGGSTGTTAGAQYQPQIKVNGADKGIVHSFEITQDAFAPGNDKSLVNYKSYYFVAIAYSFNDFSYHKLTGTTGTGGFDPDKPDSTQDIPYLESAHGFGSTAIQVIAALPNPANGSMGTVINSDYGSGVVIKRVEGTGNGGNGIYLSAESEQNALDSNIVMQPTYQPGAGPVTVKVIDPVLVKPMDWQLSISGPVVSATYDKGLVAASSYWKLTGTGNGSNVTIYSEDSLNTVNEQILSDYGISVNITQAKRPGDDQANGNGYISSQVSFQDPNNPWLAGIQDGSDSTFFNWERGGNNTATVGTSFCSYLDYKWDVNNFFGNMLSNYTLTKSTWAPYALAAQWPGGDNTPVNAVCGFAPAVANTVSVHGLNILSSVDIVFTSDRTKWSTCAVLEMQEVPSFAQGGAARFALRNHASWTGNVDASGNPTYDASSTGMSLFPGYAVNQETGERLNIVFGEDSWLTSNNGGDMLWNPTSIILNSFDQSIVFGGKHFVYVLNTRYDGDKDFANIINYGTAVSKSNAYQTIQWVGLPTLNPNSHLLSVKDGIIPTETHLRFNVTRPYAFFNPAATDSINIANANNPFPVGGVQTDTSKLPNQGYPFYTFSTRELAPTAASDYSNKNALLDRINVVPNPYYGYSGYETSRLDTKVRIVNLPPKAEIYIYSLDGSLIRSLTKADANVSYLDWDIRNTVGLPIASGMYIIDVKAEGIGEKVLRWFGATRPIDITTY